MKTILIVDDSRESAQALTLILELNGYRVFWAANGAEGLQKMREVKPDLIMLDYMMPKMNGAAMIESFMGEPEASNIKVVIHSCLAESAVNARFHTYHAFLPKPFDVDMALNLLQDVLGEEEDPAERSRKD